MVVKTVQFQPGTVNSGETEGTFIVIEGADAAGKETQTGRLVEWLRKRDESSISSEKENQILSDMPGKYPEGKEVGKTRDNIEKGVWRLSFPTYNQTPGGRVVEAYLQGEFGDRDSLSVERIIDIFAADRKQLKHQIAEYIENGGIIVCDRYREANLIHQLVDFEGEKWNEKLQYIKGIDEDLPDPDTVFYLDIAVEEAIRRMKEKDRDIHEDDNSYMKKANSNGRKVAEHEGWTVVDAECSRDELENKLRRKLENLFD